MDFEPYKNWLKEVGYSALTVKQSYSQIHSMYRYWLANTPIPRYAKNNLRRFVNYAETTHDPEAQTFADGLRTTYESWRNTHIPRGLRRKQTTRVREARSIDDATWSRLIAAVQQDRKDEARVIEVICETGLRIGDVLRITEAGLRKALQTGRLQLQVKGGHKRTILLDATAHAWRNLHSAMCDDFGRPKGGWKNVAHWICPVGEGCADAGDGAYARVHRRLKRISSTLGIDERVYLHRLRRTRAVQALRVSKDIPAVQQLLGHSNFRSTMLYLDEARPDEVVDLQRQIQRKFDTGG